MITHSATLELNERIQTAKQAGQDILHLGFGEAGLPVLPEVAGVLASATEHNSYGPVAGSEPARRSAAGYFTRRGLATEADQILLAPGSKALLFGLLAILPGDVILPRPSWVTYAAQAALLGKRVLGVPIPPDAGGIPDPERLDHLLRTRSAPLDPAVLVLTLPDNPTGTLPSPELVKRVCEIADHHGLVIISDEIYRDLRYEPEEPPSPASLIPERTIVTSGLSKNMALGGWRIGVSRLPKGQWGRTRRGELIGVASEVWSSLAAPMQAVAEYVYDEPDPVTSHIRASRRLHQQVAQAVHAVFEGVNVACRPPAAAFYLYPDLESSRPKLAQHGVDTGRQLADHLLREHGIGVLAGEAFGDSPEALRFRVATSLLYGETTEQRWQALASDAPTQLPWIAAALTRLQTRLHALLDD